MSETQNIIPCSPKSFYGCEIVQESYKKTESAQKNPQKKKKKRNNNNNKKKEQKSEINDLEYHTLEPKSIPNPSFVVG